LIVISPRRIGSSNSGASRSTWRGLRHLISTDVHQLGCLHLANCRDFDIWLKLRIASRSPRHLVRDHRPLAGRKMPPVEVLANHIGYRVLALEGLEYRIDARGTARLEAVTSVEDLSLEGDDRVVQAVGLDVLYEEREVRVRHHWEDVGERVTFHVGNRVWFHSWFSC
jgi:hypothetical protein